MDEKELHLTKEQEELFIKTFKIGIYKQLHRDKLINDLQLQKLIEMNS